MQISPGRQSWPANGRSGRGEFERGSRQLSNWPLGSERPAPCWLFPARSWLVYSATRALTFCTSSRICRCSSGERLMATSEAP